MDNMKSLLNKFEQKLPEVVFEWQDPYTEAKGWAVINSLRGYAAGGGTRMRPGLDKQEVTALAKTMEIKFAVAGPPIGGAKSGIAFDPQDPRKPGVLRRWYRALLPLLKQYYGTGGDLNVDEMGEVIPYTRELGLVHPQEGIVTGHYNPDQPTKDQQLEQLNTGVAKPVTDPAYTPDPSGAYTVADLITGYGVAKAAEHYYRVQENDLTDQRVIIQGWGNVSASAAYYAAANGARIIAIIDRHGGLLRPEGMRFEEVQDCFLQKQANQLPANYQEYNYENLMSEVWDQPAEILIPGAASRLLQQDQLERLYQAGLQTIVCGANVPFADEQIFYGQIAEWADQYFAVVPDFIANLGMARVFAYLMQPGISTSDEAIFGDVSRVIKDAVAQLYSAGQGSNYLMKTAYQIALERVLDPTATPENQ
jgi:glutamate dehydrogenase/leucine dehydrogenase